MPENYRDRRELLEELLSGNINEVIGEEKITERIARTVEEVDRIREEEDLLREAIKLTDKEAMLIINRLGEECVGKLFGWDVQPNLVNRLNLLIRKLNRTEAEEDEFRRLRHQVRLIRKGLEKLREDRIKAAAEIPIPDLHPEPPPEPQIQVESEPEPPYLHREGKRDDD